MKEIILTRGFVAKVSDEDFEFVNQFKWYCSQESRNGLKNYAVRWVSSNGVKTKIRMHRLIMGLEPKPESDQVVDHINGDSLDNQRHNLEIITQAENRMRAGFGLFKAKRKRKNGKSKRAS